MQSFSTVSKKAPTVSKKVQSVSKKYPEHNCKQKSSAVRRKLPNVSKKAASYSRPSQFWSHMILMMFFGLSLWLSALKSCDCCDCDCQFPPQAGNRCDFRNLGGGGVDGPDHLLVVPPGKRPRDPVTTCMASFFRGCCVCGCVCSCFPLSLYLVYPSLDYCRVRPAKCRARHLQGARILSVYFSHCYLEGGSLDGGDLVSPRCLGPSRSTSEGRGAAHGPRHPAYPLFPSLSFPRSLILFWGFGSYSF